MGNLADSRDHEKGKRDLWAATGGRASVIGYPICSFSTLDSLSLSSSAWPLFQLTFSCGSIGLPSGDHPKIKEKKKRRGKNGDEGNRQVRHAMDH